MRSRASAAASMGVIAEPPLNYSAVQRDSSHRTHEADPASSLQARLSGPNEVYRLMKGVHDMVLKGFSYAMIGAFLGGLAMTVVGSAGVLMGL